MACDHALAESVGRAGGPAVLRLFGWDPPAISVGYGQPLRDVADRMTGLRRSGVDLVRRPTGGGAVLHADEVTYSVAAPLASRLLENGPRAACERIHAAILTGLESLGISGLALHGGQSRSRPGEGGDGEGREGAAASPTPISLAPRACFAAASRSEISWRGRKLVGSAQRRMGAALLQHGSILLAGDQGLLAALWPEAARTGVATLAEAGRRRFGWEEVADAVGRGFERELGAVFEESPLEAAELRRIEELIDDAYECRGFLLRV
jgi:lipoate-protein ligase A